MDETKEQKEYVISYETIFELLRREKNREELQKLELSFYKDVMDYLGSNRKALSDQSTLDSFDDKKRRFEKELDNLKRILRELYEKREKKIINLALDKSRIKTNIVDTSTMLQEEKEMFDSLVRFLDDKREKILFCIFEDKEKKIENIESKEEKQIGQIQKEAETRKDHSDIIKKEDSDVSEQHKETKLVRFTHAVPKFLGQELEEYGPFEEEDVANLPFEIAKILIDKGRAEEINTSQ